MPRKPKFDSDPAVLHGRVMVYKSTSTGAATSVQLLMKAGLSLIAARKVIRHGLADGSLERVGIRRPGRKEEKAAKPEKRSVGGRPALTFRVGEWQGTIAEYAEAHFLGYGQARHYLWTLVARGEAEVEE